MKFRASNGTPKFCNCPLPEKHTQQDEIECDCCKHMSFYANDQWSKKAYCKDGAECMIATFPYKIQEQWDMMSRCIVANGMSIDLSVERFKFFINDVLEIDKKHWFDIWDDFQIMLQLYLKYKDGKDCHITGTEIEKIKELRAELDAQQS